MNIVTPVRYHKLDMNPPYTPGYFIKCPNGLSIQISTNRASPDEEEAIARWIVDALNAHDAPKEAGDA